LWRFGEATASIQTYKRWYANFKRDDFDIENKSCFGWPTAIDDDSIRAIVAEIYEFHGGDCKESKHSTAYNRLRKLEYVLKFDV